MATTLPSKQILAERILHVVSSIQSNYSRKNYRNVSVYQLINRIFHLYQIPIVFLFYEKKYRKYNLVFHTFGEHIFNHIEDKNVFLDCVINKYHNKPTKRGTTLKNEHIKKLVNIDFYDEEESPYYFLILEKKISETNFSGNFPPLKKEYISVFEELWENLVSIDCFSKDIGIGKRIKFSLECIRTNIHRNEKYIGLCELKNKKDAHFIEKGFKSIEDLTGEIFSEISKTPVLCKKGKEPSNIFFFFKTYEKLRYDVQTGKTHSIKMVMGDEQKDQIKTAFSRLVKLIDKNQENIKIDFKKRIFKLIPPQNSAFKLDFELPIETGELFPIKSIDDDFWKYVKTYDHFLDDVVEVLTSTYGDSEECIVDEPFSTGFVSIVFNPSIIISKISSISRNKKFSECKSLRRYVYLHYLFALVSPDSINEKMSVMIVPIRVGGVISTCLLHIGSLPIDESKEQEKRSSYWKSNYTFFNDTVRHCVRRLRYGLYWMYIEQAGEIIYEAFSNEIDRNNDNLNILSVKNKSNYNLSLLSRIFPYKNIKIDIYENENNYYPSDSNIRIFGGRCGINFQFNKNKFFMNDDYSLGKGEQNDVKYFDELKCVKHMRKVSKKIDDYVIYKLG